MLGGAGPSRRSSSGLRSALSRSCIVTCGRAAPAAAAWRRVRLGSRVGRSRVLHRHLRPHGTSSSSVEVRARGEQGGPEQGPASSPAAARHQQQQRGDACAWGAGWAGAWWAQLRVAQRCVAVLGCSLRPRGTSRVEVRAWSGVRSSCAHFAVACGHSAPAAWRCTHGVGCMEWGNCTVSASCAALTVQSLGPSPAHTGSTGRRGQ